MGISAIVDGYNWLWVLLWIYIKANRTTARDDAKSIGLIQCLAELPGFQRACIGSRGIHCHVDRVVTLCTHFKQVELVFVSISPQNQSLAIPFGDARFYLKGEVAVIGL